MNTPITCRTLGHAMVDNLCAWCGFQEENHEAIVRAEMYREAISPSVAARHREMLDAINSGDHPGIAEQDASNVSPFRAIGGVS